MSKVAIKGNASGTGTFTLEAPNSNTDRTLVLPDEAGTVLTSASLLGVSQLPAQLSVNDSASSGSLAIDSSGRVTMPYQPMFCAYPNTTSGYNDSPLKYDATIANVGNHYNTSTYRFTAPIAGTYYFSFSIWTSSVNTTRCAFYKNAVGVGNSTYPIGTRNEGSANQNDSASLIITLAQNDYVDIRVYVGDVSIFGTNYFLGYLIG